MGGGHESGEKAAESGNPSFFFKNVEVVFYFLRPDTGAVIFCSTFNLVPDGRVIRVLCSRTDLTYIFFINNKARMTVLNISGCNK